MTRSTARCRRCRHTIADAQDTAIGERRVSFNVPGVQITVCADEDGHPTVLHIVCTHCGQAYSLTRQRLLSYGPLGDGRIIEPVGADTAA